MSLVLNVEILGEFKKLTAATQGAQNSLSGLQKKASGIAKGIGRVVGALGLTLGFSAMVRGFNEATEAAEQARVANDRIEAIAKSMDEFGNQTAKVTKRIQDYADSQEFSLGVDADVIKATQAKLLTFRNLTKTAGEMSSEWAQKACALS
jgi:predicted sugar kinase